MNRFILARGSFETNLDLRKHPLQVFFIFSHLFLFSPKNDNPHILEELRQLCAKLRIKLSKIVSFDPICQFLHSALIVIKSNSSMTSKSFFSNVGNFEGFYFKMISKSFFSNVGNCTNFEGFHL